MDETQKAKIVQFLNDERMSDAVKEAIRESFLKNRKVTDVNYLAGQMIAFNLLNEAFKDLERFQIDEKIEHSLRQVGI